MPEVRERLNAVDFEVVASTPDEFERFIRVEIAKWAPVIRQTGARAE
jgi:tripartite-type tricarboxylate transporter receptor subunit TctC